MLERVGEMPTDSHLQKDFEGLRQLWVASTLGSEMEDPSNGIPAAGGDFPLLAPVSSCSSVIQHLAPLLRVLKSKGCDNLYCPATQNHTS